MTEPLRIVQPPTVPEEIRQGVVGLLKDALAQAEAGELDAVIVILKRPTGWSDMRSGVMDFPDAIGRLEIVKQSWIAHYLYGET
jgi:hypothetical protein